MKYQPRNSKREFDLLTNIVFDNPSIDRSPMETIPAPPLVREWPDTLYPYELLKGWRYLGDRTFRYDTTDDAGDHLYPALAFSGIIGGHTYRVTGEIVDFESNSPPPSTGQKVTLRFGYIGTNSIDLNAVDHAPYTFLDLLEVAGDENGTIRFITNDRARVKSFQIRNLMIEDTIPVDGTMSTGWTKASYGNYVFDAPPGNNFASLTFLNLTIGNTYRIKFDASGDLPVNALVFRPGDFAEDTVVVPGSYDFVFIADDANGTTRFAVQDITDITQFKIENINIVPY